MITGRINQVILKKTCSFFFFFFSPLLFLSLRGEREKRRGCIHFVCRGSKKKTNSERSHLFDWPPFLFLESFFFSFANSFFDDGKQNFPMQEPDSAPPLLLLQIRSSSDYSRGQAPLNCFVSVAKAHAAYCARRGGMMFTRLIKILIR